MTDNNPSTPANAEPAERPPAPQNDTALSFLATYFSLPSALTFVAIAIVFGVCIALWDVVEARPYLAAGGAGLAAFLGPIPGIVSPESRTKWLLSIFVAAAITFGTWLATRDLESKLEAARDDLHVRETVAHRAELAAEAARASDAAHDAFVTKVLLALPPAGKAALFTTAPHQLWAVYNEKKNPTAEDNKVVLDMSLMLLAVDRFNGHALYYAGQANAKLGNRPEMLRLLQHYLAAANDHKGDAESGNAAVCYKRANGFCAERTGWIDHMMADHYLTEALTLPDNERPAKLAQALDYEQKAVVLKKWPPTHHHPGFDTGGVTPGNSSCKILLTIIGEQRRLGIDPTPVIQFGQQYLTSNCGVWPSPTL